MPRELRDDEIKRHAETRGEDPTAGSLFRPSAAVSAGNFQPSHPPGFPGIRPSAAEPVEKAAAEDGERDVSDDDKPGLLAKFIKTWENAYGRPLTEPEKRAMAVLVNGMTEGRPRK